MSWRGAGCIQRRRVLSAAVQCRAVGVAAGPRAPLSRYLSVFDAARAWGHAEFALPVSDRAAHPPCRRSKRRFKRLRSDVPTSGSLGQPPPKRTLWPRRPLSVGARHLESASCAAQVPRGAGPKSAICADLRQELAHQVDLALPRGVQQGGGLLRATPNIQQGGVSWVRIGAGKSGTHPNRGKVRRNSSADRPQTDPPSTTRRRRPATNTNQPPNSTHELCNNVTRQRPPINPQTRQLRPPNDPQRSQANPNLTPKNRAPNQRAAGARPTMSSRCIALSKV